MYIYITWLKAPNKFPNLRTLTPLPMIATIDKWNFKFVLLLTKSIWLESLDVRREGSCLNSSNQVWSIGSVLIQTSNNDYNCVFWATHARACATQFLEVGSVS